MLESERVQPEKAGWFSTVDREIFALDPFSGRGVDTGATATERAIIMPARPYQVLAEKNPPGFREVRKFVVSESVLGFSFCGGNGGIEFRRFSNDSHSFSSSSSCGF